MTPGGLAVGPPPRGRYRPIHRGDAWREVSLWIRVSAGACECCQRRLISPARLHAGHLVAEVELWALGVRGRYLLDRRGLAALCKRCHEAFDVLVVGVRRLAGRRVVRLRRWRERYAADFRRLAGRRARWLATVLAETDGAGGAGEREAR